MNTEFFYGTDPSSRFDETPTCVRHRVTGRHREDTGATDDTALAWRRVGKNCILYFASVSGVLSSRYDVAVPRYAIEFETPGKTFDFQNVHRRDYEVLYT